MDGPLLRMEERPVVSRPTTCLPPRPSPMTRLALALLATLVPGCSPSPSEPGLPDADVRIVFVGNSLTASYNLPGLVATIGKAQGRSVEAVGLVAPNYSLEEHWRSGTAGRIRELRPDVVVFQQGPSSLPSSRQHLLAWTDSFATVVREVGATPAFLMVWPELARVEVLDAVRESYRAAAERAGGRFLPAGEAWRPLLSLSGPPAVEGPDPYGPDGFHPSLEGSVLTAYVVVRGLFGVSVQGLPASMDPADGRNPPIELDPAVAALIQRLADEAVEAWPPTPTGAP